MRQEKNLSIRGELVFPCKIWGRPFFELEVGLPQEVGLIFECIENGDWIGSDLVILETWSVLLMFLEAFCDWLGFVEICLRWSY